MIDIVTEFPLKNGARLEVEVIVDVERAGFEIAVGRQLATASATATVRLRNPVEEECPVVRITPRITGGSEIEDEGDRVCGVATSGAREVVTELFPATAASLVGRPSLIETFQLEQNRDRT